MVRLKVDDKTYKWIGLKKFQFQYGAIKRIHSKTYKHIGIGFQFQYGAIKRTTMCPTMDISQGFNSNMVRLKAKSLLTLGGM